MDNMVLTSILKANDEIDERILNNIMFFLMDNITKTMVDFWGNQTLKKDKLYEIYFSIVIDGIKSLFKMNSHRRSYIKNKGLAEIEILTDLKKTDTKIDLAYERHELTSDIDGFLTQFKATLDTLARSLNPLFNLKFDGWHKAKGKSGIKIVNALNNLPSNIKIKIDKLNTFIQDNIDPITYLVLLRDIPMHRGGLKNVSNFTYRTNNRSLVSPKIIHPDGTVEDVEIFLTRQMNNFVDFVQNFIFSSLISIAPGMTIGLNQKGGFVWYIPKENIK